jgi:L-fuconolactonase
MRIDAHQHFWRLDRGDYGWLTPDLGAIHRDFLPGDLTPLLQGAGIDGTILVQAAPTMAETEFLLTLAERHAFIKGVVGWVDFDSPAAVQDIDRLAAHAALVGLRPMIQDIADDDWMLRPALTPVLNAMAARGLTFDALVLPRHLGNLGRLLARHPDLRVVIDHGAKPQIRDGAFDDWAAQMTLLAQRTTAFCKLSGLVTEAAPNWTAAVIAPYVRHLLDTFGPERLIWGSDWPVCTLAARYAQWLDAAEALVGDDPAARAAVFGANAQRAYRLRPQG